MQSAPPTLPSYTAADVAGAISAAPDTLAPPTDLVAETGTPIGEIPTAGPVGLERVMVQADKLYVVLAVVLVIWTGLLLFLFRTDRRLDRLERALPSNPHEA